MITPPHPLSDETKRRLKVVLLGLGVFVGSGIMLAVTIFGMAFLSWFMNILTVPLEICGINGIQISERPLVMMGLHGVSLVWVSVVLYLIADSLNSMLKRW